MSLRSTDITKVKRLSLRDIKLPAPELRVEPFTPILVERPPSDDELAYSRLVAINPLIEELVDSLGLVSYTTGKKLRLLKKPVVTPIPRETALSFMEPQNNYSKEQIVGHIKQAGGTGTKEAEEAFYLILEEGKIERAPGDRFFLSGYAPF